MACLLSLQPVNVAPQLPDDPDIASDHAAGLISARLHFEANHGQVHEDVRFLARGKGYTLFLTDAEAVLSLAKGGVVRMSLNGSNATPRVRGGERLPGVSNYFIGNDPAQWQTRVPHFARVQYEAVYPGIDLVYYRAPGGDLEFDFVVAPGADPSRIGMYFDGADRIERSDDGRLLLHVGTEQVSLKKPVVYQMIDGQRQSVACAYEIEAGGVGLRLAHYDASRTLVIDPEIIYATYFGGSSHSPASDVEADADGNAYVTGWTSSADLPIKGAAQSTHGGGLDAYVTKFAADGQTLVYSTYLGGSAREIHMSLAVDGDGNAIVTGQTESTDFPLESAFDTTRSGATDCFVAKLDAAGSSLVYSSYLGGDGSEFAGGVTVDTAGNAIVVGNTRSSDLATTGVFQTTLAGSVDAFAARITGAGSLSFATYLGGHETEGETANDAAVDADGNIVVVGLTSAADFPTHKALQPAKSGHADGFVTKLDPDGVTLRYSTFFGGSSNSDAVAAVALDDDGTAYISGVFATSPRDPFPTLDPLPTEIGEFYYLAKIDSDGTLTLATRPGIGGVDIELDAEGNIYLLGGTRSLGALPLVDATQGAHGGALDAFVMVIDAAVEEVLFSTPIGGSSDDGFTIGGNGLALDGDANIYVAGGTNSADFPTVEAFIDTRPPGREMAFVVKISSPALTVEKRLERLCEMVLALQAEGALNKGQTNALKVKLEAAMASWEKGKLKTFVNQLGAFTSQVDAFVSAAILTAEEAAELLEEVAKILE